MKKTALALTFILALLFSVVGTEFISLAEANPEPAERYGWGVYILSPKNRTYSNPVNLKIEFVHHFAHSGYRYSVDGGPFYYMYDEIEESFQYHYDYGKTISNTIPLNLSDGYHTIVAKFFVHSFTLCTNVTFRVDTVSPHGAITSPENKTYSTSNVTLTFNVNEPVSEITYCLDGQDNITIGGNTTLTVLSYGYHNVTIYATDEAGNTGVSETVYFTIAEPFPKSLVIATSVSVAVVLVGVGLLLYGIKRKQSQP